MISAELYVAERTMNTRVEEELHRAKSRNLLRQTGIEQQGWLSRQGRRLVCQLGHLLVALGERLEQPQSLPLKGEMRGGR